MIFVFGSNLAGIHGAGAANHAFKEHGAKWGQGFGLQGNSFAIPTKDRRIKTLPLPTIEKYVGMFLRFAKDHPELTFSVTRIGCGLAGYTDSEIRPMFKDAPENCILPDGWRPEKRLKQVYTKLVKEGRFTWKRVEVDEPNENQD